MSKRLKKIISIVIMVAIIASNLIFNSADCNALPAGFDIDESSRHLDLYIVPYDNITVKEAIPYESHVVVNGGLEYDFYSKLYIKQTMQQMYLSQKTTAGVVYHYEATLKSSKGIKINNYTASIINSVDKNDGTIFSNYKFSSPSQDSITVECDVVFKPLPALNLGNCDVYFAKEGGSIKSSDSRFDQIFRFLEEQGNKKLINVERQSNNLINYDLDKNGTYDICCSGDGEVASFYPLETSSITGSISMNELDDRIRVYEYNFINYYDKYTFNFSKYVPEENKQDNKSNNNSNSNSNSNSDSNSNSNSSNNNSSKTTAYKNEWVKGKWYNSDGVCDYAGTLEWKSDSTGWWVEDTSGWYPVSQWQKIDGKWYYFLESGYMDYSEYRNGYWLGVDGAVVDGYQGEWKSDSKGWWFEDTSGWYPQSQWLWINGKCYYFESDGYLATSKYVDGYWVGADGACQ